MQYNQILTTIISMVFVPLLGWAVAALIAFLNEKTALVKSAKLQAAIKNAIAEVESATFLAVTQIQSTFVDALKAEGKWTPDEAKIAVSKSLALAKKILSDMATAVLLKAAIDINAIITAQIEASLEDVKTIRADVITKEALVTKALPVDNVTA